MTKFYIYLIEQDENTDYDTYDAAVVVAKSEEDARDMHPSGGKSDWINQNPWNTWCFSRDSVRVTLIGKADPSQPPGVILASFNAGKEK